MTNFETEFAKLDDMGVILYLSHEKLFNESVELAMGGFQDKSDDLFPKMWLIEKALERKGIDTIALFC